MSRFVPLASLVAGVATLALSVPLSASPGGGHGGGGGAGEHGHGGGGGDGGPHGGGGGGPHRGDGGGPRVGGGPSHGGGAGNSFAGGRGGSSGRGHGGVAQAHQAARGEHGPGRQHGAGGPKGRDHKAAHGRQTEGGKDHGRGAARAAIAGAAVGSGVKAFHGDARRGASGKVARNFGGRGDGGGGERVSFRGERPNLLGGCPPGLAKKYNGCNPPGLVKTSYEPWRADWWGYPDSGYRYYDGYLLRTSGPTVLGYVPLLGGALFIGEIWPAAYETSPVPEYYSDYYNLGPDYRYYDDTFYRLEPRTGRIVDVAGFLTGDEFVVGEPIPAGYDVYNVPWDYRNRYADGPDAWYRYVDGYVYRIDPKTMLILAAIQLLT